jgi:hypothetical protein
VKAMDLKQRLAAEGFRSDVYCIDGPLPSYEGLILEKSGTMWRIEHFERGVRRELESFGTEERACERMYELLVEHFRW